MVKTDLTRTQAVILSVLAGVGDAVAEDKLEKLIYFTDLYYFSHTGQTATEVTYLKGEDAPTATDHEISKQVEELAERGLIEVHAVSGSDRIKLSHPIEELSAALQPMAAEILGDVLRKFGPLGVREISEASRDSAPWQAAKTGGKLVMTRSQRQMPVITKDDWERHLAERRSGSVKSIADVQAKYQA
jgi:uncharacterized phage-associated protein